MRRRYLMLMTFCLATLLPVPIQAEEDAVAETAAEAEALTLGELVQRVKEGSSERRRALEAREQRFIEARDERAAMFREIARKRREEEALADELRNRFEAGEDELADLETLLDDRSGDLKDVFTAVGQVAADARASVQNSMVSAELGDRSELLSRLASADTLPSAADLRALWLDSARRDA